MQREYNNKAEKTAKDWLLAVNCMLFLISAAVFFTLVFRPLYYFDMEKMNLAEETGYTREEISENYEELIDYNLSMFHKKLEFPTFPMSEEARIHFQEVKRIFQGFILVMLVTGILAAVGAVRKRKRQDFRYLRLTGILSLAVPLILGILAAVNWDSFFVTFHRLVFRNDYWLFDPVTDPIILVLPDTYFLHCAMMIFGLVGAGAVCCLILGRRKPYFD